MKGQRVEYDGNGPLPANGSYWKQEGIWYCATPNGHYGNLKAHQVTEHPDGTITVSPSILISGRYGGKDHELYHGWLQAGEWKP